MKKLTLWMTVLAALLGSALASPKYNRQLAGHIAGRPAKSAHRV
jgi:hypothetical protein